MNTEHDLRYRHPLSNAFSNRPRGPMRSPARVLGWYSIGLGLAELLMPRAVARLAGAPNLPFVTRLHGLREIGLGTGLLLARDPEPWLWGRVAGDVIDVATVAPGLATSGRPARTVVLLAVIGAVAYADVRTAEAAGRKRPSSKVHDYSTRSGFPKPASEMRGAALNPDT